MSDETNNPRGESNSVSEERIRRCLLGAAAPAEQSRFEELLLIDDEFEKRVRQAEFELADDFSFERLNASERELFRNNFLVTSGRVRKVEVSQALRASLSHPIVEGKPLDDKQGNTQRRLLKPGLLRYDHPAVSLGLTLMALVLIGGLLWLVMKNPRIRQPEIVKRQPTPSSTREFAHPVSSQPASPSRAGSGSTTPTTPVATLVLRVGGQSDEQQIHFSTTPEESDIVRLELVLGSQQSATYKCELLTSAGEQISVTSELKLVVENEHTKVVWDVPAQQLKPGSYQVKLSWLSDPQNAESLLYSFSAR